MSCCVNTLNEGESQHGLHEHKKVYLNINLHDSMLWFKTLWISFSTHRSKCDGRTGVSNQCASSVTLRIALRFSIEVDEFFYVLFLWWWGTCGEPPAPALSSGVTCKNWFKIAGRRWRFCWKGQTPISTLFLSSASIPSSQVLYSSLEVILLISTSQVTQEYLLSVRIILHQQHRHSLLAC